MKLEHAVMIDYAKPLINAEVLMREVHNFCLARDYNGARDKALLLGAEIKVLQHILTIMEERK